ncbi:MAG: hypothetical protein HRT90_04250 [Candidatus Margulisbacteria bacterium]|nr:hypothetical protein [Candidatus Margulisiibacteriota bacterium]
MRKQISKKIMAVSIQPLSVHGGAGRRVADTVDHELTLTVLDHIRTSACMNRARDFLQERPGVATTIEATYVGLMTLGIVIGAQKMDADNGESWGGLVAGAIAFLTLELGKWVLEPRNLISVSQQEIELDNKGARIMGADRFFGFQDWYQEFDIGIGTFEYEDINAALDIVDRIARENCPFDEGEELRDTHLLYVVPMRAIEFENPDQELPFTIKLFDDLLRKKYEGVREMQIIGGSWKVKQGTLMMQPNKRCRLVLAYVGNVSQTKIIGSENTLLGRSYSYCSRELERINYKPSSVMDFVLAAFLKYAKTSTKDPVSGKFGEGDKLCGSIEHKDRKYVMCSDKVLVDKKTHNAVIGQWDPEGIRMNRTHSKDNEGDKGFHTNGVFPVRDMKKEAVDSQAPVHRV